LITVTNNHQFQAHLGSLRANIRFTAAPTTTITTTITTGAHDHWRHRLLRLNLALLPVNRAHVWISRARQ
jgi:hypothetical protein